MNTFRVELERQEGAIYAFGYCPFCEPNCGCFWLSKLCRSKVLNDQQYSFHICMCENWNPKISPHNDKRNAERKTHKRGLNNPHRAPVIMYEPKDNIAYQNSNSGRPFTLSSPTSLKRVIKKPGKSLLHRLKSL